MIKRSSEGSRQVHDVKTEGNNKRLLQRGDTEILLDEGNKRNGPRKYSASSLCCRVLGKMMRTSINLNETVPDSVSSSFFAAAGKTLLEK